MASTYSSRLRLELVGSGEQGGAWAATTNRNLGTLVETAIAGYVAIAFASDANDTADAFDGADDEARNMVVKITGALTAQRNMVFPVQEKIMFVINGTTGGFGVQIIGSSGTGVVVPTGKSKWVYCDGTNWAEMAGAASVVDTAAVGVAGLSQAALDLVTPPGSIVAYAGITAPTGWLMCDGSSLLRATYASLFTAISTTFGTVDGTHFTLPDLRGRVIAGQDDMGGTSANRLTNVTGGIDGDVFGSVGGSESHALTTAQLSSHTHTGPSHTHTMSATFRSYSQGAGSGSKEYLMAHDDVDFTGTDVYSLTSDAGGTGATGSAGSGTAHNNVQPTMILNYIIRTGLTT